MTKFYFVGALLFVLILGCDPSKKRKKVQPQTSTGNVNSQSQQQTQQQTNNTAIESNPASLIDRDGTFIAESDSSLQDQFLAKFGRSQCNKQWIGFLQRKRFAVLVSHMRPSIDSEQKIVNSDGSESYYLPTTVVGYWVELRKFLDRTTDEPGRVEIREYAPVKTDPTKMRKRIYRWRTQTGCKKSMTIKKVNVFATSPGVENFSDRNLRSLVKQGSGLLYLWSPQMPYSTASLEMGDDKWGLIALFEVAKKNNLPIKFLLDPQANLEAAQNVATDLKAGYAELRNHQVIRSTSVDLYMRMTGLHLPTMLYYEKGLISRVHLPGISSAQQMTKYISEQKKRLGNISIRRQFQGGGQ